MKTHWFPLIRPAIKPLFLGGGTWPEGDWLNSHETQDEDPPEKVVEDCYLAAGSGLEDGGSFCCVFVFLHRSKIDV